MGRIIRIFHISVRNIGSQWNTTGTFGFVDCSDFATGITSIKFVDPVLDTRHINTHAVLVAGVEIVIDGNIANTMFWECDIGVQSGHSRVSAKSGKVFCDTYCHIAGFNFIQHFLKTRTVKGCTAITIVHEKSGIRKAIILGILKQDIFLIHNGIAITSQRILLRKSAI